MAKILELRYENPRTHAKTSGRIELKSQGAKSADLYIYGDICSSSWDLCQQEDICPQDVVDLLASLQGVETINIYINSGGGDSFAGIAIYNNLKRSGAALNVTVDAMAASAAGLIAMLGCLPGNTLHMAAGAEFMMHNCWTVAMGNANDFEALIPRMRKCDQDYIDIYKASAADGVTAEQLNGMMDATTHLNGSEMGTYFRNISTDGVQLAACADSAFFSQKPTPPVRLHDGVIPDNISTAKAAEETAWHKPTLSDFTDKQWGDLTDQEQRDIAGHFAWAAQMPPDSFGDLKYGHHDPKTHDVVWDGIVSCAGRISQSDIPDADLPKVKAHIADHYHQFGKTAPWEDNGDESAETCILKAKLALACVM